MVLVALRFWPHTFHRYYQVGPTDPVTTLQAFIQLRLPAAVAESTLAGNDDVKQSELNVTYQQLHVTSCSTCITDQADSESGETSMCLIDGDGYHSSY